MKNRILWLLFYIKLNIYVCTIIPRKCPKHPCSRDPHISKGHHYASPTISLEMKTAEGGGSFGVRSAEMLESGIA
jgi:hypothetical protein